MTVFPGTALTRLRGSAIPFLLILVISNILGTYANYLSSYLWSGGFTFRGQSLGILIPSFGFLLAVPLWLVYQGRATPHVWLKVFLGSLGLSWLVHIFLAMRNGDPVPHTVWLFLPILVMFVVKTPSGNDTIRVLQIGMVLLALVLVSTKLLEEIGIIPTYFIPQEIVQWEATRYWIPLDGILGFEGRWPGPFGYNSMSGTVAAILILFACGLWSRLSYFLLPVGLFFLLATDSRVAYLATASGLLILFLFSRQGWLARIPIGIRWAATALAAGVALTALLVRGPGTTGRLNEGGIWSDYLTLWATSPLFGVGTNGFLTSPDIVDPWYSAHSMYVQELAKYGITGFAIQYLAIGVGVLICLRCAVRFQPWPLALTVAYLVAGISDVLHDGWLAHNIYFDVVILATLAASSFISSSTKLTGTLEVVPDDGLHGWADPK